MVELEKIGAYLEQNLSERRYRHSIGVMEEAIKLAEHYGADVEKAKIAGLTHDCAKEIGVDDSIRILKDDYGITPDAMSLQMPRLLHGALGSCIVQSRFGIYDTEILDAIRYHTTGKADMSLLSKIIYIADYIEPNRNYEDVDILRGLAYKDIDSAIIFGIDFTIQDLIEKGKTIHPDTLHCRNDIIVRRSKKEA